MYSFSYLEPVCCSMSSSNCCFLTCIQISQEAGQVVWYSFLFENFPQFIVIHTIKVVWGGLTNSCEKKRSKKQRRKGTLLHCWWERELIQPLWRTVWRFLKKLGIKLLYDPAISLLGKYPEKIVFQKTHVPQYSQQHCLQQPELGSNLDVH